jgi:hypothetical protein
MNSDYRNLRTAYLDNTNTRKIQENYVNSSGLQMKSTIPLIFNLKLDAAGNGLTNLNKTSNYGKIKVVGNNLILTPPTSFPISSCTSTTTNKIGDNDFYLDRIKYREDSLFTELIKNGAKPSFRTGSTTVTTDFEKNNEDYNKSNITDFISVTNGGVISTTAPTNYVTVVGGTTTFSEFNKVQTLGIGATVTTTKVDGKDVTTYSKGQVTYSKLNVTKLSTFFTNVENQNLITINKTTGEITIDINKFLKVGNNTATILKNNISPYFSINTATRTNDANSPKHEITLVYKVKCGPTNLYINDIHIKLTFAQINLGDLS